MELELDQEFMAPLVKKWLEKIELAKGFRKPFEGVANQCQVFFSGAAAEFWSDAFQQQYIGKNIDPQFKMSLNKAFELVALFGPVLYNRNPVRSVNPYKPIDLEVGLFGDEQDPYAQAMFQQAQQVQRTEFSRLNTGCKLMESYLNYTPKEQPEGGLKQAAEDAITDALLAGRGLLWPDKYTFPGSNRTLTGCFYSSWRDLYTDPDARRIEFGDTRWVARAHTQPYWEVERRFKLPSGSLKRAARKESADAQAGRTSTDLGELERQRGNTFDLMTWYEIWSIGGAGGRLSGIDHFLKNALDKHVGDFAYMCVAKDVPWFLNCPTDVMRKAYPEEIKQRLSWPVPYWADRRWPFATLEFYRSRQKPYPIPPLAPGLGELTFLNFLLSRTAQRVWDASKTTIAVVRSAAKEVKKQLNKGDLSVLELDDVQKNINELVSYLQVPDISNDVWQIAAQVMELFDKRVGLTELMYGLNPGGATSRTATDVQAKQEKVSIRPDYMAGKVEDFLSEVSSMEKMCAHWSGVSGKDVAPLVGSVGAQIWDSVIVTMPPEVVSRQMVAEVVVGSAKKRNKQLELANMNQTFAPLSQLFGQYAATTGDSAPLNKLVENLHDALDADAEGMQMGPWAPPHQEGPDPEQVKMQLEVQKAQADLQAKQAELAMKQQGQQAELAMKNREQEIELRQDAERHEQELTQDAQVHAQEMLQRAAEASQKLKIEQAKGDMAVKVAKAKAAATPKQPQGGSNGGS